MSDFISIEDLVDKLGISIYQLKAALATLDHDPYEQQERPAPNMLTMEQAKYYAQVARKFLTAKTLDLRYCDYETYRSSARWKLLVQMCHTRDEGKCRLCWSDESLECHHATYLYRGWSSEPGREADPTDIYFKLELNSLCLLCRTCHTKYHKCKCNFSQ